MAWTITYQVGAELPHLVLLWQEQISLRCWQDLDLSSGYTFTLTLTNRASEVALTKITGITGANGYVTVSWAIGELSLPAETYKLRLVALETSSGKNRSYSPDSLVRIKLVE